MFAWYADGCRIDRFPAEAALIYTMHEGAQEVMPMWGGGAIRQLDIPSLTPLSVAGCGRLAIGVPPLGYFSRLLQVVDD